MRGGLGGGGGGGGGSAARGAGMRAGAAGGGGGRRPRAARRVVLAPITASWSARTAAASGRATFAGRLLASGSSRLSVSSAARSMAPARSGEARGELGAVHDDADLVVRRCCQRPEAGAPSLNLAQYLCSATSAVSCVACSACASGVEERICRARGALLLPIPDAMRIPDAASAGAGALLCRAARKLKAYQVRERA